jgi:hypothetical protein
VNRRWFRLLLSRVMVAWSLFAMSTDLFDFSARPACFCSSDGVQSAASSGRNRQQNTARQERSPRAHRCVPCATAPPGPGRPCPACSRTFTCPSVHPAPSRLAPARAKHPAAAASGRAANNCTTLVYEKEISTFWRRRRDFFQNLRWSDVTFTTKKA